MADMTEYQMLDDVNLTVEDAHVTADTHAIAGYVNGRYANWPAIVAKYGRTNKYLLSIDVQGNASAGAQALDVEKGDAKIDQASGWVRSTRAAGIQAKDLRVFPKVYVQESNAAQLVDAVVAGGSPRDTWLLWTAHFDERFGAHICGPKSCGCTVQADATQYTNSFDGASLDASLCYGYFFSGPGDVLPEVRGPVSIGKPESLKAFPSYRGVDVTWAAVAGAGEYDVQLLEQGKQAGRETVTEPKASFPVSPSESYSFRVAALPGGEWSEEFKFTTPAAPIAPVEPQKPPVTPEPVIPVVPTVPEPAEPVEPPAAPVEPAGVLVYVQEILTADIAGKLGLPAGTILYIPHTVAGD